MTPPSLYTSENFHLPSSHSTKWHFYKHLLSERFRLSGCIRLHQSSSFQGWGTSESFLVFGGYWESLFGFGLPDEVGICTRKGDESGECFSPKLRKCGTLLLFDMCDFILLFETGLSKHNSSSTMSRICSTQTLQTPNDFVLVFRE